MGSELAGRPINAGRRIPTISDRQPDQILTLTTHSLSSAVPIERILRVSVAMRNHEPSNFVRRAGCGGDGADDVRRFCVACEGKQVDLSRATSRDDDAVPVRENVGHG